MPYKGGSDLYDDLGDAFSGNFVPISRRGVNWAGRNAKWLYNKASNWGSQSTQGSYTGRSTYGSGPSQTTSFRTRRSKRSARQAFSRRPKARRRFRKVARAMGPRFARRYMKRSFRKFKKRTARRFSTRLSKALLPYMEYRSENSHVVDGWADRHLWYFNDFLCLGDYMQLRPLCALIGRQEAYRTQVTGGVQAWAANQPDSFASLAAYMQDFSFKVIGLNYHTTIRNTSGLAQDVSIYWFKCTRQIESVTSDSDSGMKTALNLFYASLFNLAQAGVPVDPLDQHAGHMFDPWGAKVGDNPYNEEESTLAGGVLNPGMNGGGDSYVGNATWVVNNQDYRVRTSVASKPLEWGAYDTSQLIRLKDHYKLRRWFKCYAYKKYHIPPGDMAHFSQTLRGFDFSSLDDNVVMDNPTTPQVAVLPTIVTANTTSSQPVVFRRGAKFCILKFHGGIPVKTHAANDATLSVSHPQGQLVLYTQKTIKIAPSLKNKVKRTYIDPPYRLNTQTGASGKVGIVTYTTGVYQEGEDTGISQTPLSTTAQ